VRDDPVYIAQQLGHEGPAFTFKVYQRAVKRREKLSGQDGAAYDQALDWGLIRTASVQEPSPRPSGQVAEMEGTASASGTKGYPGR
jgi:hypothetical protein